MHILITGGAGFLGCNLARRLVKDGHKVTILDNLQTGRIENISELLSPLYQNVTFYKVDISHICSFSFDNIKNIDQIYNLACAASPPRYQKDGLHTLETNYTGSINMLRLAQKHGARLLQASTSEIYGDPLQHPQSETYWGHVNPIGVRSCYDEGKRVAETLCYEFRKKGVDARIARIFNTYGPNMDPNDGRVVSNFITQYLKNIALTIYGNGKQTRCFCYVDDMIEGLIRLMNHPTEQGPVNLGSTREINIIELMSIISGSEHCIQYEDLPSDDPCVRKPDITRAKTILGWEPDVPLEVGLQKTVAYFRKCLNL